MNKQAELLIWPSAAVLLPEISQLLLILQNRRSNVVSTKNKKALVGVGSVVVLITACMHAYTCSTANIWMLARLMVMARKASFNFCLRHSECQYDAGREGSHLISSQKVCAIPKARPHSCNAWTITHWHWSTAAVELIYIIYISLSLSAMQCNASAHEKVERNLGFVRFVQYRVDIWKLMMVQWSTPLSIV